MQLSYPSGITFIQNPTLQMMQQEVKMQTNEWTTSNGLMVRTFYGKRKNNNKDVLSTSKKPFQSRRMTLR